MAEDTIRIKSWSRTIEELLFHATPQAGRLLQVEEITATAAAITPGMLLELDNAGLVKAHSDNDPAITALPPLAFALEDVPNGGGIDTAYANSATIQVWYPSPGDEIYAWLVDEGNVAIGALLNSDGAGALQAVTLGIPQAQAIEAVNNTGGEGPVRIRVRAI